MMNEGVAAFSWAASPKLRLTALHRRSRYFLRIKHRETTPIITKQKLKSPVQVIISITSPHGKVTNRQTATLVLL
jgi:hypothetical protein